MPPPDIAAPLPYLTPDLPGIGGRLRAVPAAFVVEEAPLYPASGEGPHLYVTLTRANLTTRDVAFAIERTLRLPRGAVGYAGLKDKAALTTQTFSILVNAPPAGDAALVEQIAAALPVTIHGYQRHRNKLKAGHLLGNRFRITIQEIDLPPDEALARAAAIAARLRASGAPNYFGPQRFGARGDNALAGYEILHGTRRIRDRWTRQFLISAYQSHLCNRYLALRVARGLFGTLLAGDIAKKHDTGGLFDVADPAAEQPRFDAHAISFTAPMFGAKMRRAGGEAAALEAEVEAETGLTDSHWRAAHTEGTRRLGRLLLPDLTPTACAEGMRIEFFLPKGGFATTVLREFMKSADEAWAALPEDADESDP